MCVVWRAFVAPPLCVSDFVLLWIRCPHGTVLLDMIGPGRNAVGMDDDVAAGVKIRGTLRGRMVLPGVQRLKLVRSYGTRLRSCRRLDSGEDCSLGQDAGKYGQRRAYIAGMRVLGKELERHSKTLNGPKNTAKHIKAKQNWITMESKRVEAESAKVAEMQESMRVRKETLRAAHEEIKKLRADMLWEGKSMDKKRSHVLSPESLDEVRNFEQQELSLRRAIASKRLVGRKTDRRRRLPAGLWQRTESRQK